MDDADAAQAGARRVANEVGDALARGVAAQAVQVDLVLEHPDAAAKLSNDVDADAAAAKRERVVGLEQRFDVERIGDRFGQRRRLVALALARERRRPRPRQCRRRALLQRHDGTDGGREQALLAPLGDDALALDGRERLGLTPLLEQGGANLRQIGEVAALDRRAHSKPRSANDTACPWPTTR